MVTDEFANNKQKNWQEIVQQEIELRKKTEQSNGNEEECMCPYCQSKNVYGISRVIGYFSIIENWNESKQAEFKRRQRGKYWDDEKLKEW
jgi:anaerobic ribonucleoside-triphosphate reductase